MTGILTLSNLDSQSQTTVQCLAETREIGIKFFYSYDSIWVLNIPNDKKYIYFTLFIT